MKAHGTASIRSANVDPGEGRTHRSRHAGDEAMAGMIRKQGDDTAVVHLCGPLTHAVFDRFAALLDHLDRTEARCYIVDMTEVDFIDSSGIGMLLMAQELAEHRECDYRLRGVGPVARSILDQARVSELFVVEPSPGATPGGPGSGSAAA